VISVFAVFIFFLLAPKAGFTTNHSLLLLASSQLLCTHVSLLDLRSAVSQYTLIGSTSGTFSNTTACRLSSSIILYEMPQSCVVPVLNITTYLLKEESSQPGRHSFFFIAIALFKSCFKSIHIRQYGVSLGVLSLLFIQGLLVLDLTC
jgi:hypothetical protein